MKVFVLDFVTIIRFLRKFSIRFSNTPGEVFPVGCVEMISYRFKKFPCAFNAGVYRSFCVDKDFRETYLLKFWILIDGMWLYFSVKKMLLLVLNISLSAVKFLFECYQEVYWIFKWIYSLTLLPTSLIEELTETCFSKRSTAFCFYSSVFSRTILYINVLFIGWDPCVLLLYVITAYSSMFKGVSGLDMISDHLECCWLKAL